MKVLIVTSEWPTPQQPWLVPWLVHQVDTVRELGVDFEIFPFRGARRPINYWRARRRLTRVLKAQSFDLIHAHFGQSGLVVPRTRLPLLVTFHGAEESGIVGRKGGTALSGYVLRAVSRFVAHRADHVITVSRSLQSVVPRGTSTTVIPVGIDFDVFKPAPMDEARRDLGLPLDRRLVLFPVRSADDPRKRLDLARRAVAMLPAPGAELVVVERQPHQVVARYMAACDVLIVTSKHEGSQVTVREALACDLPVVSVDVGDARERIGDLDGCELCEDDRPETIAAALHRVLTRQTPFRARDRGLALDQRDIARQIVDVYEQMIGERASKSA